VASRPEEHRACNCACQRAPEPWPGSFSEGQKVDCWEPARTPIPRLYQCGNPACFKIFSPEGDKEAARARAQFLFGAGAALLAAGLALYIAAGLSWVLVRRGLRRVAELQ